MIKASDSIVAFHATYEHPSGHTQTVTGYGGNAYHAEHDARERIARRLDSFGQYGTFDEARFKPAKIKASDKKRTIVILYGTSSVDYENAHFLPVTERAPGLAVVDLSIIGSGGDSKYAVVHVDSGLLITKCKFKVAANRMIDLLATLGNWTRPAAQLPSEMLAEARQICRGTTA